MAEKQTVDTISSRALIAQESLLKAISSTSPEDIERAISQWEPLANAISPKHPDYEPVLASYAVAILLRWEDSHQLQDIRKAILTLENAVTSLGNAPSRNRYQNLVNLGSSYFDRFETFNKDPKDILRAVECMELANTISITLGFGTESANKLLSHLGDAYFYGYEVGIVGVEAVYNAIRHFQTVLSHGAKDKQGSTQYKIGQCYSALYNRLKKTEDLDLAIKFLQASTEHELYRDERQGALMELSRAVARKYDATRDQSYLEEAIRWARMTLKENEGEPSILRNLANLLYWKYKDLKDNAALDEAIEYYEIIYALYQTKPGRSLASFYYSYGTALIRRFDAVDSTQHNRLQDIERAVDLMEWAVKSAAPQSLEDYEHRLKGAKSRRDRLLGQQTASPPATMRSSNTIGFPSSPSSPTSVSFAEQQTELPKRSNSTRRAPIPSLASHPDNPGSSTTTFHRVSASSETRRRSGSRASEAASDATVIPTLKRGQTAPSLLSESMSVMSVPAVQDLPAINSQQARPRVLRRATRSIPMPTLAKPPPPTKFINSSPDKPRRDFLSFARLLGPKPS
ncbi:SubName: Full=Uncharacterized protein {ECO:0000313/EMBL:CCA69680.1} [Serendipita indica DSM 11827]|uniref:Uncharacterized protein n=1 Tax=Serendipita indica (strain DSM 11827) TaxID=1109443 RepID=G4TEC5_SERID|nr:SubName: Full=Uncharacterized protein {ECO:0000313/EMBL:CCA69680.1} [Serendipita indica DSM 11827]CCA69680.1 hypothetical protein PIIN_03619 [Serendipita indica DSM 11827]